MDQDLGGGGGHCSHKLYTFMAFEEETRITEKKKGRPVYHHVKKKKYFKRLL